MKLDTRDRLALMMTSQGSQRRLAAFIGVSHQRIGRWLRFGEPGGPKSLPTDPTILRAINDAFGLHSAICKARSALDGLHFNSQTPIFAARLPKQKRERFVDPATGEIIWRPVFDSKGKPVMIPGDRVAIDHTHWLPDKIRNKIIADAQKSGKYHNASVGSLINLHLYNKNADERFRDQKRQTGIGRTRAQAKYAKQLRKRAKQASLSWVFTPYVPMPKNVASDLITNYIDDSLRSKHQPATGEIGTALAAQVLLQIDTRTNAKPSDKNRVSRRRR